MYVHVVGLSNVQILLTVELISSFWR